MKTKEQLELRIAELEDAIACAELEERLDGDTNAPLDDWLCELGDLERELRERFGGK